MTRSEGGHRILTRMAERGNYLGKIQEILKSKPTGRPFRNRPFLVSVGIDSTLIPIGTELSIGSQSEYGALMGGTLLIVGVTAVVRQLLEERQRGVSESQRNVQLVENILQKK